MTVEAKFELNQDVWVASGSKGTILAFSVSTKTGREYLIEFEDHRSYWFPEDIVLESGPVPVQTIEEETAAPASVQEAS